MKRILSVLAMGFLCLTTTASHAQQMSSDVAAVLRASVAAQIGNNTVSDVSLSGTVEHIAGSDDETVAYLFKALSSGSTRTETDLGAGTLVEVRQITASGRGGVWSNGTAVNHAMAGHNLLTDSTWPFPVFILERFLTDPRAVVTFLGTDGGLAHFEAYEAQPSTITADAATELQHLSQIDIFLDATTYLPVSVTFNIHADTNAFVDIPVSIQFSSYQTSNGLTAPMHIQEYVNGSLASDIHLQTVTVNTGLTLSDFATN